MTSVVIPNYVANPDGVNWRITAIVLPLRTLSGMICSEQIVEKFGIQNSPFLLSCKISEYALLVVIELHLDLGGDKVLDKLFPVALNSILSVLRSPV